jgi:hypothetical protein
LKTKTSYKKPIAFQKKSPTDLSIKESERIIRQQNLLTVTITVALPEEKSDSVDVYIRVLDSWSSIPKISLSAAKNSLGLKKFFWYWSVGLSLHRSSDGKSANNLAYTIPNIRTFVKTLFKYQNDLDKYYEKSIAVERPFYSPSKMGRWYLFRSAISKRHYTRSRFDLCKTKF